MAARDLDRAAVDTTPPDAGSLAIIRTTASGLAETFILITADGAITAFNGHVDLGTGIRTALALSLIHI